MRDPQIGDDILDSREIISRIDELEGDIAAWEEDYVDTLEAYHDAEAEDNTAEAAAHDEKLGVIRETLDEFHDELKIWREFEDAGAEDWDHGAQFIHEDYFIEYTKQFAEDVVADLRETEWPFNHIDWEAAAEDLKHDYSEVDVQGNTYYAR